MLLIAALALPVGAVSACVAWALLQLIGLITNAVFYDRLATDLVAPGAGHHNPAVVLLAPIAGGLVIGLMARYGSEKIRGHGMPEAIEAILLGGSKVQPRVAVLKPVSAAVAIGTGGPFGAEGPIIMTGGAVGSLFAQFLRLTADERKTLLVAGAAGGMAATFNSPFAALMLAVELLLFEWRPRSYVPVAAAVCVAAVVRRPLLGTAALFPAVGIAAHRLLDLRAVHRVRHRVRAARPGRDRAGLRRRGRVPSAAGALDVVARDRRAHHRHRRPDRPASPRRRLQHHRRRTRRLDRPGPRRRHPDRQDR